MISQHIIHKSQSTNKRENVIDNCEFMSCDNWHCEDTQIPLCFGECNVIYTWKMGMDVVWQYVM